MLSTAITAADLAPIVNGILDMVPLVVGVMVPLIVINKGLSWVRGWIYSA